jgi:hypothetical protein
MAQVSKIEISTILWQNSGSIYNWSAEECSSSE